MNKGTQRLFILLTLGAAACGGASAQVPASSPTTTNASIERPVAQKPEAAPEATPAAATAEPTLDTSEAPKPEAAKALEPCESRFWWSCVSVPLAGARKVEKRTSLLIGDPAFEETRSGTTDGHKAVMFTTESGDVVSVMLKRRPGGKSEIVLRSGKSEDKLGAETVIDRHDGDDFQYVSVVATAKGGTAYVDVRYMR